MIPSDLEAHIVAPPNGNGTIVLATGNEPRHRRFALRIQQEFGNRVIAWYEWQMAQAPLRKSLKSRMADAVRQKLGRIPPPPPPSMCIEEVERLAPFACVSPSLHPTSHINSQAFVAELQTLAPSFFLTLGGPLYPRSVLDAIPGLAINQHAGWSPDYRGTLTTHHAIYHRDLRRIGATVHITHTGADSGVILRRSNPTLCPNEAPEQVFERVVILGTELMIEVIHDFLDGNRVLGFSQPSTGRTYLSRDYTPSVAAAIWRDVKSHWLARALEERVRW